MTQGFNGRQRGRASSPHKTAVWPFKGFHLHIYTHIRLGTQCVCVCAELQNESHKCLIVPH